MAAELHEVAGQRGSRVTLPVETLERELERACTQLVELRGEVRWWQRYAQDSRWLTDRALQRVVTLERELAVLKAKFDPPIGLEEAA